MNKNLGKIFFSIVFVGIIFIGISLFNLDKNNVQLEDIHGNRNALGDMNILLQSKKGFYETDEIKINKENISIKRMAKEGLDSFNLTKRNIDSREILETLNTPFTDNSRFILEAEEKIVSVELSNDYIFEEDSYELIASIKVKNKKSDKVESYVIPMDESYDEDNGMLSSVPILKDKDNIYIVILYSSYEDIEDDSKISENQYERTLLNLYKVNLSSKKSKHILSKEYDGKDIHLIERNESVAFSNKNKSYFFINKKNNSREDYKSSLLEFDVISKEINIIDLGTNDDEISRYYVDDNRALIISNYGSEEGSNEQDLESGQVRSILVNLEDKKVEYINHINLNINGEGQSILQVRINNGKIYVVTDEYEPEDIKGKNFYCIYVFNEKDNKLLYKGKINQRTSYRVNAGIVTEDEL